MSSLHLDTSRTRRTGRRLCAIALAAWTLLAGPASARANGRFPAAGQIAVDPADPTRIVVRATYGILTTSDAGRSWGWICEPAVGYSGSEDPVMGVTSDGSLVAGIFEGLAASHDGGCTWSFAGGELTGRFVVDVSVDPNDGAKVLAILSNGAATPDTFTTQLWQTTDQAFTWKQLGVDLPASFLALTADRARSDENRIYVSGRGGGPPYLGMLQRSNDGGASWSALPVTGADDMHLPYIAAIDPQDADTLYVRLAGPACADPQDTLVVSKDGGMSWSAPLFTTRGGGNLLGFALSPDGATVAVGSATINEQQCTVGPDARGLWRAPASTLAFEKVSSLSTQCLTWRPEGLYACANEFIDHFTAGLSTDAGDHFTPILHLGEVCGPLACGPMSSVNAPCPAADVSGPCCAALWEQRTAMQIGAIPCTDAGTDGGSTGGGSTGGGPPPAPGKRCGCTTPGSDPATGWAGAGLVVVALARQARRRRR